MSGTPSDPTVPMYTPCVPGQWASYTKQSTDEEGPSEDSESGT